MKLNKPLLAKRRFARSEIDANIRSRYVPLVGWQVDLNTIWVSKFDRRIRRRKQILQDGVEFPGDWNDEWDDIDDFDDFDDFGDYEDHGIDCDCDECTYEHALGECGELPKHLGGGCSQAGSEYCDFECPFRNRVLDGDDDE